MFFANANPNEYLVVGRGGKVINRGTGIRVFLWPGSTYVLVPATKLEASFEMTQETKDGIPMHFKGIVIYRIIHPEVIAQSFDFNQGAGVEAINLLIRNICLGELRAVVSGMTMQECIEQRKTVLTSTVAAGLRQVVLGEGEGAARWGIDLEMVQVAQVYIIDNELRKQLEAEVRNSIRTRSDQSDIRTREETRLAQIASERRLKEQGMVSEKEAIRQKEEIEVANMEVQRRLQTRNQELACEAIALASEKFHLEQEAERQKTEVESPVRLLQLQNQQAILARELETRQVECQVRALEVQRDMALESARQELRSAMLPIEQVPEVANALSGVFQGANLSIYGSENQALGALLPLFEMLAQVVRKNLGAAEQK